MNKYILLLCLFVYIGKGFSQKLTYFEYFIDKDPGYGLATAVPFTSDSTKTIAFTHALSSEQITNGYHTLSVRVKDANNRWSMVLTRPFYKESLETISLSNLTAMEYFIDSDPGYGSGNPLSITSATSTDKSFIVSLPESITNGYHTLSVRVKDANNRWSIVLIRPFYKESLATMPLSNLTAMEYFIDNDPGYGAATSVNMTADTSVIIPFTAALGNLSLGIHTLYVRVKDANNRWSMVGMRNFEVSNTFTLVSSQTATGFCRTTTFSVAYHAVGTYPSGNIFTAQLSDANGSFNSPINLGSISSSVSGVISAKIPLETPIGSTYKLRVISSNPSVITNPSIDFSVLENCPPPCPQTLELKNPTDNYSNVVLVKEANAQSGWIVASNKISGNSRLTYTAGRSITLLPGFEAGSGTVFLAQKGGCN